MIKCVVKGSFFISVRAFIFLLCLVRNGPAAEIRNKLKVRSGFEMNYFILKIHIIYHIDDKRMIEHFPSLMDQLSESSAWRPSALAPHPQSHQPSVEEVFKSRL